MKRYGATFILLVLSVVSLPGLAQTLTEKQKARINTDVLEAFSIQSGLDFQFKPGDVYKEDPKEFNMLPASQVEIDLRKAKMNGKLENDSYLHYETAQLYGRMYNREKAQEHYKKAIAGYRQLVERDKTKAMWFAKLGELYSQTRQYAASERVLTIALELDSVDSTARVLLPTIYLMTGQFEDARKVINQNLKYTPLDIQQHSMLTSIALFEFFSSQNAVAFGTDKEYFKNQPIDSILDLSRLKTLRDENPKNTDINLLYHLTQQMALLSKAYFTYSIETRSFSFNEEDQKLIRDLRSYYKKTMKEKGRDNKYVLYHSYAFTLMLENQFDEALSWCKKALKVRGKSYNTTSDHTGQVYDNMISCHLLMGDTSAAHSVAKEKLKDQPGIDPSPQDHVMLGRFSAWQGNYEEVDKLCQQAIAIDTFHVAAWTGRAFTAFAKNDYKLAEEYINMALKIDDTNLEAGMMFSFILLAQGEKGSSKYLFERLLQLNPDDKFLKEVLDFYFAKK